MDHGQARVAQSGLCWPLCPTGQQQQEDEVSEWKEIPRRGDRASTGLTHGSARHIATRVEHMGALRLAEPGSLLEKKRVSKLNICICFLSAFDMFKCLLCLVVKVSAF